MGDKEYNKLFTKWAGQSYPGDHITNADIRRLLLDKMDKMGYDNFEMSRPKLMAMMRLVDDDRSGSIGFREFRHFATMCIAERDEHRAQAGLSPIEDVDGDPGTAANPLMVARSDFSAAI